MKASQEIGSPKPGDYVTGKLRGVEDCRQGVLFEARKDGTSILIGERDTYFCEGSLTVVPDLNLRGFPETIQHVNRIRAELAAITTS